MGDMSKHFNQQLQTCNTFIISWTVHTCTTDFKKRSVLDACSKNLSVICFILFNPISSPSFKHSEDRGMRIIVASDDDHDIFWPIIMGINWSRNRWVKLVPEIPRTKKNSHLQYYSCRTLTIKIWNIRTKHPRKFGEKLEVFTPRLSDHM